MKRRARGAERSGGRREAKEKALLREPTRHREREREINEGTRKKGGVTVSNTHSMRKGDDDIE